jgi:hypothetical protein
MGKSKYIVIYWGADNSHPDAFEELFDSEEEALGNIKDQCRIEAGDDEWDSEKEHVDHLNSLVGDAFYEPKKQKTVKKFWKYFDEELVSTYDFGYDPSREKPSLFNRFSYYIKSVNST